MTDREDQIDRPAEGQGPAGRVTEKGRERGLVDENLVERARENGLQEKANGLVGTIKNRSGGR